MLGNNNNAPLKAIPNYKLWLGTIGIVYGDIGTSPLYTIKECFSEGRLSYDPLNVFGIISLILWSLIIVVTLKYVLIVLRADNKGQGGILALGANVMSAGKKNIQVMLLIIAGAALFYGDGVITPAISVLGALEGLSVLSPDLDAFIVPLAVAVVSALFILQKWGTHKISRVFGPIIAVWFMVLALLGTMQIINHPEILACFNPWYALQFFAQEPGKALLSLSSVFLAVTGVEALYADMGHFSKGSIRQSWLYFVFPALCLNYMGQGALLLRAPGVIENPFYQLAPAWAVMPLIVLATMASFIASQAVISGFFSLTWQAIQLGYLPRMKVIHTSFYARGHVYIPTINLIIGSLTVLCILMFRSSDNLASAYGITVNMIMIITTLMVFILSRRRWRWSLLKASAIMIPLLFVDTTFLSVNALKILDGGWFTILIALIGFMIMRIWLKGRTILVKHDAKTKSNLIKFFENRKDALPGCHVPGTAVYMSNTPDIVPSSFLSNHRHNYCLHDKMIFLSIIIKEEPKIPQKKRLEIVEFQPNIYQVKVFYGFMEAPQVSKIVVMLQNAGLDIQVSSSTFFFSRTIAVATAYTGLNTFEEEIFVLLSRLSSSPADYFDVPHHHAIELGTRIEV